MKHFDRGKNNRVWEIDALRGHLILWVLLFHFYFCVVAFCVDGYYRDFNTIAFLRWYDPFHIWFSQDATGAFQRGLLSDALIDFIMRQGVDVFFVLSGISCTFSRDNLKRSLKVYAAGLFVAAFTYGLSLWTGDSTRFIRFGVLMCYGSCQLIYHFLLKKWSNESLFMLSAPILALGYYFRYHGVAATKWPIFYLFGVPQIGDQSSDFWPIFPMLGWFLLGVVIGRKYYAEKKSLWQNPWAMKLTRPLQFLGRHSGVIYVGHIALYPAIFCGVGALLGIL